MHEIENVTAVVAAEYPVFVLDADQPHAVEVDEFGGARLAPTERQISARQRFDGAIAAAGKGLEDILWRVVCSGEGMREAESALGWPARAGKLVLTFALDRVADYYRIR